MLLLWQLELSLIQAVKWWCDFNYIVYYVYNCSALSVVFTQPQFIGSEQTRFVTVNLELIGGTSAGPFSVTVTPSEQSPVSAEGNSVMCVLLCVDWRMFD